jgi:hypothetical protein
MNRMIVGIIALTFAISAHAQAQDLAITNLTTPDLPPAFGAASKNISHFEELNNNLVLEKEAREARSEKEAVEWTLKVLAERDAEWNADKERAKKEVDQRLKVLAVAEAGSKGPLLCWRNDGAGFGFMRSGLQVPLVVCIDPVSTHDRGQEYVSDGESGYSRDAVVSVLRGTLDGKPFKMDCIGGNPERYVATYRADEAIDGDKFSNMLDLDLEYRLDANGEIDPASAVLKVRASTWMDGHYLSDGVAKELNAADIKYELLPLVQLY